MHRTFAPVYAFFFLVFRSPGHVLILLLGSTLVLVTCLPWFTQAHPSLSSTSPQDPFPVVLRGERIEYASPTLANIDSNPDDLEIIVGGIDGRIHAYKADGTRLWERDIGPGVQGAPAVGDINNDGYAEILAGASGNQCVDEAGGLVALDRNGNVLWVFRPKDICEGGDGLADGVRAAPTIADLDLDGTQEIIIGAWDHRLYVLKDTGTGSPSIMFEHNAADTIWSSPAIGDINGDGYPDIVVGADLTPPGSPDRGRLWAFDYQTRSVFPNFPKVIDESVWSSPALGDINNDGKLEIVVGTAFNRGLSPDNVYAFDGDGNALPGWPQNTTEGCFTSPALADFEGDGDMEIVIGCENTEVYAWHHDGTPVAGWAGGVAPRDSAGRTDFVFLRTSPTIADYDSDGNLEILLNHRFEIVAMNTDRSMDTNDGSHPDRPAYRTGFPDLGSPAVADIDGDGKLEMVIGSGRNDPTGSGKTQGTLYVWETGSAADVQLPWPQFQQNAQHTGLLAPRELNSFPSFSSLVAQTGNFQTRQYNLPFTTSDGSPLNWTVELRGDIANLVSLNRTSGTERDMLQMTITGENIPVGTYTGTLIMQEANGELATEIPITIQVEEELEAMFLPAVIR